MLHGKKFFIAIFMTICAHYNVISMNETTSLLHGYEQEPFKIIKTENRLINEIYLGNNGAFFLQTGSRKKITRTPQFLAWNQTQTKALLHNPHSKEIIIFDALQQKNLKTIPAPSGFKNATFISDKELLICFTEKKTLFMHYYDLVNNKISYKKHVVFAGDAIDDLLFLNSNNYIIYRTTKDYEPNITTLFDIKKSKEIMNYNFPVIEILQSIQDTYFALITKKENLKTAYIYTTNSPKKSFITAPNFTKASFTGDGSLFITQATYYKYVTIYDLKSLSLPISKFELSSSRTRPITIDPTNTYLLEIDEDFDAILYDLKIPGIVYYFIASENEDRTKEKITAMGFNPNGTVMALSFNNFTTEFYYKRGLKPSITKPRLEKLHNVDFSFK